MAALGNMSLNNTGTGGFNETTLDNSGMVGHTSEMIAAGFGLLISILGIIGNSLVFWYLSFRIKRTKYTVYIINLAIADLIYLIFFSIMMCISLIILSGHGPHIDDVGNVFSGLEIILNLGMNADMFLLMAISMERCWSVLYPFWYRCNRPKAQSVLVCVFLWGLSILVTLVDQLGCPPTLFDKVAERCTAVQTFLAALTFLVTIPIMVVSSLILIIKVRKTSKQHQPPKLFYVIVASVTVFLISIAPVRLLWLLLYLKVLHSRLSAVVFFYVIYLWVSINSSLNPFIYFLVGRHKMQGVQEYFFRALKKVFKEEEVEMEEENGAGAMSAHDTENTTHSNIS